MGRYLTSTSSSTGQVLKAQQFTSGTTAWVAPSGECWVTGCGGGGGGGRGGTGFGGGGGGGAGHSVLRYKLSVTQGASYSVVIGGAGAGGFSTNNGANGGSTTFGALLTLPGGSGAATSASTAGTTGGAAGGNGGTSGTRGENYITTYETVAQGGFGGISFPGGFGAGGDGGQTNTDGKAGNSGFLLVEWWE